MAPSDRFKGIRRHVAVPDSDSDDSDSDASSSSVDSTGSTRGAHSVLYVDKRMATPKARRTRSRHRSRSRVRIGGQAMTKTTTTVIEKVQDRGRSKSKRGRSQTRDGRSKSRRAHNCSKSKARQATATGSSSGAAKEEKQEPSKALVPVGPGPKRTPGGKEIIPEIYDFDPSHHLWKGKRIPKDPDGTIIFGSGENEFHFKLHSRVIDHVFPQLRSLMDYNDNNTEWRVFMRGIQRPAAESLRTWFYTQHFQVPANKTASGARTWAPGGILSLYKVSIDSGSRELTTALWNALNSSLRNDFTEESENDPINAVHFIRLVQAMLTSRANISEEKRNRISDFLFAGLGAIGGHNLYDGLQQHILEDTNTDQPWAYTPQFKDFFLAQLYAYYDERQTSCAGCISEDLDYRNDHCRRCQKALKQQEKAKRLAEERAAKIQRYADTLDYDERERKKHRDRGSKKKDKIQPTNKDRRHSLAQIPPVAYRTEKEEEDDDDDEYEYDDDGREPRYFSSDEAGYFRDSDRHHHHRRHNTEPRQIEAPSVRFDPDRAAIDTLRERRRSRLCEQEGYEVDNKRHHHHHRSSRK